MQELKKKYGLFTAICMVVGIVIGSGIFFKAPEVLAKAGYNALYTTLAWVISGIIMVIIATTFAFMATKYEKVGGAVDYAEAMCGKKYGYYVGWFMSMVYNPAMTAVLAWLCARYTLVAMFGNDDRSYSTECITIALFYLIISYFINTMSPTIAGKFQISTTFVKLVPIAFIAIVGTVVGLVNGNLDANFHYHLVNEIVSDGKVGLFPAICTTVFAYEGWIVATSINSEIKNSKRNLPLALCIGAIIIVVAYTLYNLGILGLTGIDGLIAKGNTAAFKFFGNAAASVINIFVIVSCLGTLNGLMLGGCRGIYSLAARGEGFDPETYAQVDKKTNMPHNSAIFSLMMCAFWFVYFVFFSAGVLPMGKVSNYVFDSSELPIITLYALYIPMLISMMIKEKEFGFVKRFVFPILSLIGVGVIIYASIDNHGMGNVWYLIVFGMIMLLAFVVSEINKRKSSNN